MLVTSLHQPLTARLAETSADRRAAQRLRHAVFVQEGGARVARMAETDSIECDEFDPHADHLLLIDPNRDKDDQVIGTYRLMTRHHARAAGGFYSQQEYDLSPLLAHPGGILELGRSCLHPDYRGGTALLKLWHGIGRYVDDNQIDLLFGVASFKGTNPQALRIPLSYLHHTHLAPPNMRARAQGAGATRMHLLPQDAIDPREAARQIPALIKAYLRLGGVVGDGAFVDHAFNTTDVCLILDAAKMSARQRALYGGTVDA